MRLFFLLFQLAAFSLFAKPLDVRVSASSAVLMNADTGALLYEKEAYKLAFPGSTTKVATALYILDKLQVDLNRTATVSAEALRMKTLREGKLDPPHGMQADGTMMKLIRGEILTMDSLLHGLMMVSGNDAANVLGETLAGSVPAFMGQVNEYLASIGCKNTHFCNPHGLYYPDHVTTAYDMALMTKRALRFPKFRELVTTLAYQRPKTNKQPPSELKLFNPLLKKDSRHYYPKAIGVKTGFTTMGKNTLVAAATSEGRTLIAVLFGCEKSEDRYLDAKRLFETAFAEKKQKHRFFGPENRFTRHVDGSEKLLKATLTSGLEIEYFPSEEPACKAFVHWATVPLPIKKGQKVGEIQVLNQAGTLLQKGDLVSLEEVKGTFVYIVKDFFRQIFSTSATH